MYLRAPEPHGPEHLLLGEASASSPTRRKRRGVLLVILAAIVLAGAGGCVAQRVLGMEFAADFINGLLNRAILEGGEACAAGANGSYLERA